MNVFCLNNIWWNLKKTHWAVKKIRTVCIILNHKKPTCKFIFLHISAFQRVLPILSVSFRMFRQFDLLSTLFMSLTFRISDKQMHVTCNCKSVHCIYAKSFSCAVLKRLWCLQFYILGIYHKHTICFIGHENYAIKWFPLHKISYFLLPFGESSGKCIFNCQADAHPTELSGSGCSL